MAFSDVGCGSNMCWLKAFLIVEIVATLLFISALGGAIGSLAAGYSTLPVPAGLLSVVSGTLIFSGLHLYFLFLPLRADGQNPVAHQMWRHFSHYGKLLIACVIIWTCVAIVVIAVVDLQPVLQIDFDEMAVCSLIFAGSSSYVLYHGLLLLLAKNCYHENVEEVYAASKRSSYDTYI